MNGKPVFFSVIILAYHVEPYLRNCLDSVLRQRFKDYEIIIVNPVPNDETEKICREYAEKYRHIQILDVPNRGQLLNRTAGFSKASGRYLVCLDGDDWWHWTLLEKVYATLKTEAADMVIFGHQRVEKDKIVRKVLHTFADGAVFEGKEKRAVYEKFIQGGPINEMWTRVISRELFAKITEDFSGLETIRKGEDLLYNLYLADASEKIVYIDAPLYYYRQREGSVIRTFRPRELEDTILVKGHIRNMMEKWGMEGPKYIDAFYRSIAVFYMDFIFRCCISELSFSEKRKILEKIRTEDYYLKSCKYQRREMVHQRHWLFVRLFRMNNLLALIYGKLYCIGKKAADIKNVLGDGKK